MNTAKPKVVLEGKIIFPNSDYCTCIDPALADCIACETGCPKCGNYKDYNGKQCFACQQALDDMYYDQMKEGKL